MAKDKVYVPLFVKEHEFKDGGTILKMSCKVDKLVAFLNQHVNAKGYVNMAISRRKEVGQYGDTHYAVLDTWEPKPKDEPSDPPPQVSPDNANQSSVDLPF
jgi:hypothetical protein